MKIRYWFQQYIPCTISLPLAGFRGDSTTVQFLPVKTEGVKSVKYRHFVIYKMDGFVITQATELSHIFKKSCMTQRNRTKELCKTQLCFSACSYKLDKPFTAGSHTSGGCS